MDTPYSITLTSLKHWYAVFNQSYFSGDLPVIPLKVTSTKCSGGAVRFMTPQGIRRSEATFQHLGQAFNPSEILIIGLRMSTFYAVSEEFFKAVLIHEMIHVELLSKGIAFTSGGDKVHGREFMERLKEMEVETGMTIPLTFKVSESVVSISVKGKLCDVFIFGRGAQTFLATFKSGFLTPAKRAYLVKRFAQFKNLRFGSSTHREVLKQRIQRSDRSISYREIPSELAHELLPGAAVIETAEQLALAV